MNSDYNKPINLGNPDEFSIKELAELIQSKLNLNLNYNFKPLPQDDPLQRKPNIKLANEKLDWYPSINLNDGLERTINYFKKFIF